MFGQNYWAFDVPECQSLRACSIETYKLYPAEHRVLLGIDASTWGLDFKDHQSYGDFVAVLKVGAFLDYSWRPAYWCVYGSYQPVRMCRRCMRMQPQRWSTRRLAKGSNSGACFA